MLKPLYTHSLFSMILTEWIRALVELRGVMLGNYDLTKLHVPTRASGQSEQKAARKKIICASLLKSWFWIIGDKGCTQNHSLVTMYALQLPSPSSRFYLSVKCIWCSQKFPQCNQNSSIYDINSILCCLPKNTQCCFLWT